MSLISKSFCYNIPFLKILSGINPLWQFSYKFKCLFIKLIADCPFALSVNLVFVSVNMSQPFPNFFILLSNVEKTGNVKSLAQENLWIDCVGITIHVHVHWAVFKWLSKNQYQSDKVLRPIIIGVNSVINRSDS